MDDAPFPTMRIVITGASGRIGREVVSELGPEHDLVLLDRRPSEGLPIHVANLGLPGGWLALVRGADTIIHLAAKPGPKKRVRGHFLANFLAPVWIAAAALWYRIPRVVFASSSWVVIGVERSMAPACYRPDGSKVGVDAFGPRTTYGWLKAWGEMLGRLLARSGRVKSFLAVRIGWFGPGAAPDHRASAIWLGGADMRALFRRSVDATFSGFHVVYAVSAQPSAPFDLRPAKDLLDWSPREASPAFGGP